MVSNGALISVSEPIIIAGEYPARSNQCGKPGTGVLVLNALLFPEFLQRSTRLPWTTPDSNAHIPPLTLDSLELSYPNLNRFVRYDPGAFPDCKRFNEHYN